MLVAGVSKLTHSTSGISASVAVEEAITGTKESEDCSGRGLCDTDDRVCTCDPEYETSNGYNEEARLSWASRSCRAWGHFISRLWHTAVSENCTATPLLQIERAPVLQMTRFLPAVRTPFVRKA